MALNRDIPGDDNLGENEDENVVEAGQPTTEKEQQLLNDDAQARFDYAKAQVHFAQIEHQIADDLTHLGKPEEAKNADLEAIHLFNDAAVQAERAHQEWAEVHTLRVHDTVERMAVVVQQEPRQSLVTLSTAVSSLTTYALQLNDHDYIRAAQGDQAKARQIHETIASLGSSIKHALSRGIQTIDVARHVVQQIVEFVAAVMTVADHVPAFHAAVQQFIPILSPFIVR